MKNPLLVLMLLVAQAFSTTTMASLVFGGYNFECPADSDTYIGIAITRTPEFVGEVESTVDQSLTIVAKGEPMWDSNKFVYSASQTNNYYLKLTSGELEGAWFNIVSNDEYSLQIEISDTEMAKISADDTFEIIPHWTMQTLFPNGDGFVKSTGILAKVNSTILWKMTAYEDGQVQYPIGTNNAYSSMYYYRLSGSIDSWLDIDNNDATNAIIEPNSYFLVSQTTDTDSDVTIGAVVPMCATSFEIFTYKNSDDEYVDQDIYIPVPSASDMQLSELTQPLIDSGVLQSSTSIISIAEDIIYLFDNSSTLKNRVATNYFYYRNYSTTNNWLDSDRTNADATILPAGSMLMIRKKNDSSVYSTRVTFKPKYIN